ncbi:MAG: NUDIX domain-containing protein [Clostridiales bacterium]|nr:NUDIX domain-containing protein [Clostridiales bacterium]
MEVWNLYNLEGVKLKQTLIRGQKIPKGMYHMVVHIIIKNSNGEYLIQKRADTKESLPGIWAFTGGSAIIGEVSEDAALRELAEETGIHFNKGDLTFSRRLIKHNHFADIWYSHMDVDVSKLIFQKEEVSALDFKTKEEVLAMIELGEFHRYETEYLSAVFNI